MKRLALVLGFCLFLVTASSISAAECQFVLGFSTLRDLIGHDIVGECLENEHHNATGDSVQQTTGGLLVWRKADNWTAFTDGYRTWINGPNGLEQRLNTELLAWEAEHAIENLHWVRDGLTDIEARAVDSLEELGVNHSKVLRALLKSEIDLLPPRAVGHTSTLELLVSMSAIDDIAVSRLVKLPLLSTGSGAELSIVRSLSTGLALSPSYLHDLMSHPVLGEGTAANFAVAFSLLSLKRSDPEAVAAIEALPWVQDGIGSIFPGNWGFQFELNRLRDLIHLARESRQTFTTLIAKPQVLNDFAPFLQTAAIRGVAGDLWADVIVGQPHFSQVSENQVVPFKLFNPGGVVVDRSVSPGRAYIWDAGNSRILGVDLSTCYAGASPCVADVVIGQPSGFDHSACNGDSNIQNFPIRAAASAETLCGITDVAISVDEEHTFVTMAVDAQGNLYVPDSLNNRVLKYERPFETDSVADEVWGQSDFSGMVCNRDSLGLLPTQETLCFHSGQYRVRMGWFASGVEIDPTGNLWVADAANHRVLRFPLNHATGSIAKQADLVLGQPDFHTNNWGKENYRLDSPAAVRTDSRGQVYVADKGNDRILVFAPPFTSGMAAAQAIGSNLNRPTTLELDPTKNGIWVNDSENRSLSFWSLADGGFTNSRNHIPGRSGGGIGIDTDGSVLLPLIGLVQDVYRYPTTNLQANRSALSQPVKRLFFPPGEINFKGDREIRNGTGVAVYGDQLIAADTKRLLFWNGLADLRNGDPADGVVGETYWSQTEERCCGQIKVDGAGRLWVLGTDVTHFIKVYQLPLTEHSVPIKTIQTTHASFPLLGSSQRVTLGPTTFRIPGVEGQSKGGEVTWGPFIRGIAPVGNGDAVWISDAYNHRVLRLRNPLSNPVVDVILGQTDATGNKCNRRAHIGPWDRPQEVVGAPAADMLCFPGALSIDRLGNLFVSDHSLELAGNWRLLVFPPHSTPAGNATAILAPAATKVFTDMGAVEESFFAHSWEARQQVAVGRVYIGSRQTATWEPTFDSTNRMVVGYNSYLAPRFVGYYDEPLGSSTTPTGFLKDFGSMPYAATFDDKDNLYVADLNRNRVLIYWNPFNNPQQR